jgi:hypothetical protein
VRFVAALAAVLYLLSAPAGAQQPIPPAVKPGFPVKFPGQTPNGSSVGNQPMAADLGLSPGYKSIIFGLRNGKLYVVRRASNGTWGAAPGWPVTLPSHVHSSAAVADLTGDGAPDIVVGFGSVMAQSQGHGGARAYDRAGNLLWEVQTQDVTPGPSNGFRDPVMATPAIGDIDGDGDLEVVFGALDHYLYVVDGATGLAEPGWPRDMRDTVFSSAALHDIDGDGRLDIIVGVDAHLEGSPYNTPDGGCLQVLRYDGTSLSGFPKCIDQTINSSPAVGDIDGDGRPEIVHGTGAFWGSPGIPGNPTEAVYAWECDGSAVPGWPVAIQGQAGSSPALANLDADAALEVAITADNTESSSTFRLYAFNGNGTQLFAPVVPKGFQGETLSAGEPVIADVLGDTALEILVPTNAEVAVFSATGTQLTEDGPSYANQKVSFATQYSLSNVAVTDLETDGAGNQIEVIAVSAEPFPSATDTVVHVWNPVNRTSTPPWGFFRGPSERRTGVAPGTGSCSGTAACMVDAQPRDFFTVTPCRLVDTRNAAGAYGGPALASGALRDFTLTGRCGIPAGATALSLNITVVQPTAAGFVRFSPDCQPPLTSAINFSAGQTRANNAILPLSGQGVLTANAVLTGNSGTVHVIIDVNGYFQ